MGINEKYEIPQKNSKYCADDGLDRGSGVYSARGGGAVAIL